MRIVGVTPARGGSKRIPKKNLRKVMGRPLLLWTIDAARRSRHLDRYLVTTEDEEIAAVAAGAGVEVLARPRDLASDTASTLAVLEHVCARVPADVIVLLQATSPVRDDDLIDRCIQRFIQTGADSLATGIWRSCVGYGDTVDPSNPRSVFNDDGNVYVINAAIVRCGDRIGRRVERVELDRQQSVDIDDEHDLWLAERILEARGAAR